MGAFYIFSYNTVFEVAIRKTLTHRDCAPAQSQCGSKEIIRFASLLTAMLRCFSDPGLIPG